MILAILKGVIFTAGLAVVAVHDARAHLIPRRYLLPLLAAGLIGVELPRAITGAALMFLLLLPFAMLGGICGGDLWLLAACGFVLGPQGVLAGTCAGLCLFVLCWLLFSRKNTPHALGPYLGVGCAAAYWLML